MCDRMYWDVLQGLNYDQDGEDLLRKPPEPVRIIAQMKQVLHSLRKINVFKTVFHGLFIGVSHDSGLVP